MALNAEIKSALQTLNDVILSDNRITCRSYTLIFIPYSPDDSVELSLDGKPVSTGYDPRDVVNAAMAERTDS